MYLVYIVDDSNALEASHSSLTLFGCTAMIEPEILVLNDSSICEFVLQLCLTLTIMWLSCVIRLTDNGVVGLNRSGFAAGAQSAGSNNPRNRKIEHDSNHWITEQSTRQTLRQSTRFITEHDKTWLFTSAVAAAVGARSASHLLSFSLDPSRTCRPTGSSANSWEFRRSLSFALR